VGWANVAALGVNAALNVVLIPRLGGQGAALATLASVAVLYGLHVWNVWRLGVFSSRTP
jgi:O-antigen/teichoic acid export membrane protein